MSSDHSQTLSMTKTDFRVGFSADFRDDRGALAFPDIGLSMLEDHPGLGYDFLSEYKPEYMPEMLAGYDVLISLKPRVTAQALEGNTRLCAIGRCGVGYDNVDLEACTEHGIADRCSLYSQPHRSFATRRCSDGHSAGAGVERERPLIELQIHRHAVRCADLNAPAGTIWQLANANFAGRSSSSA